ncbi:hypothetical protein ACE1B6_12760 [Aerosakkonemataceae cyanobacterium BLCC-F154]|uniref:Uncharacterized protein n=1 Tax=Floridaenema fluviatile BLCC-F154 TaxID=3153640 RepID=A0ABV4YBC2_9CYAN
MRYIFISGDRTTVENTLSDNFTQILLGLMINFLQNLLSNFHVV